MTRRGFIAGTSAGALAAGPIVSAAFAGPQTAPAEWRPGPYLLLDDELVADSSGLVREVHPPSRLPDPIVTGYEDGCFQPYLTVVRDPETGRYRIWYGTPRTPGNTSETSIAYMESDDGIHWIRPHRVLRDPAPIQFGSAVIDEGPACADPGKRFKLGWWQGGGLQVAASPDGLDWTPLAPGPVVAANHDIASIHWDPVRGRYIACLSVYSETGPWAHRRIPHQSVSDDLLHWEEPWTIVTPDETAEIEKGETQFYGMSGIIGRGEILVSLVKVLRDDLNCEPDKTAAELRDPGRPFAGIGYTVVAWSRDGRTWRRETQPFLDRNSEPGTWDRAMAWGDDQLVESDFTLIYYGGYRWGHKAERFTGRQIGFAHMRRDRYVGYSAGAEPGVLRTVPRMLGDAVQVTVNAQLDPPGGELGARAVDHDGAPITGFDWDDCRPVTGDLVDHPIAWRGSNADLRGLVVSYEFSVVGGTVFSFDVL
jgi:hypothetical protein